MNPTCTISKYCWFNIMNSFTIHVKLALLCSGGSFELSTLSVQFIHTFFSNACYLNHKQVKRAGMRIATWICMCIDKLGNHIMKVLNLVWLVFKLHLLSSLGGGSEQVFVFKWEQASAKFIAIILENKSWAWHYCCQIKRWTKITTLQLILFYKILFLFQI